MGHNCCRFLDKYYQQFDLRVQPSLERSDASDGDGGDGVGDYDETAFLDDALTAKSFPDSIPEGASNVYASITPVALHGTTTSSGKTSIHSPYLNPVPLPAQYSTIGGGGGGSVISNSINAFSYPATTTTTNISPLDTDYAPSASAPSAPSSSDTTYKRTFTLPGHSSSFTSSGYGVPETNFIDDGYKEVPYTSKPLTSKYFGVATTTSQDIQVRD